MLRQRTLKLNKLLSLGVMPEDKILDVGIAYSEYSPFDNFLEKKYPFPEKITALAIGHTETFRKNYPKTNITEYAGGVFPFNDNDFRLAHSNAVIEHVGDIDKQIQFAKEIYRVSKIVFLTTPCRWFPIEIHTHLPFFHYLPKAIFDRILCGVGKQWASGDYMHLLSKNKLKTILQAAAISNYRIETMWFLGFPNQYIVIIKKKE